MVKVKGLDLLQRQLKDATRALEELDGELGTVQFDPHNPGSIEAAIQKVYGLVDEKVGHYPSNPIIGSVAQEMKERHRENIVQKAAEARLKGDD
jgi:hypothetical protein